MFLLFLTVEIPLGDVAEVCLEENGPLFGASIMKHYGIYEDLFNGAYFLPVIPLRIFYDFDEEHVTPVYHGNIVPASDVSKFVFSTIQNIHLMCIIFMVVKLLHLI